MTVQHIRLLLRSCRSWNPKTSGGCMQCQNARVFSTSNSNPAVELTTKRYPYLKRGQFAILGDEDLKVFEKLIPGRVLTDASELDSYNTDWLKTCKGKH